MKSHKNLPEKIMIIKKKKKLNFFLKKVSFFDNLDNIYSERGKGDCGEEMSI